MKPIPKKKALEAFLALPCCPDFSIERDTAQQVQTRELFRCGICSTPISPRI